jgi:hypothetical protein
MIHRHYGDVLGGMIILAPRHFPVMAAPPLENLIGTEAAAGRLLIAKNELMG